MINPIAVHSPQPLMILGLIHQDNQPGYPWAERYHCLQSIWLNRRQLGGKRSWLSIAMALTGCGKTLERWCLFGGLMTMERAFTRHFLDFCCAGGPESCRATASWRHYTAAASSLGIRTTLYAAAAKDRKSTRLNSSHRL